MRLDLSKAFERPEPDWQKKYFAAIQQHDQKEKKWLNQERGYKAALARMENEIRKLNKQK